MDKIIHELHKAFDYFNETKFNNELISPVITIQQNKNKKKMILGWCSRIPRYIRKINNKEQNFYEINITCDFLNRPYEEILETLIHETVHLANSQKGLEDCSSRGNHNEIFKNEAERVGLLVEKAPRIGWSITKLSDSLLKEIQEMDIDRSAFDIYMIEEHKEKKPRQPTVRYKYRCKNCHREVVSKEDGLVIICKHCEEEFVQLNKE